jgi:hypothetical protein
VPHRDLVLSPDHAVFVDDVLIPVHLLVNGATVRRLPEAGVVEYYHIELDSHDLLLAEGLPTESYLDTGNRGVFAGEATRELHPDLLASASARAWDGRACAELLLGGVRVDAVRAGLRGRAEALGFALTDRPGLRVLADGRVLAARAEGERVRVAVPAGTRMLRLLSGSFIPDELDPRAGDRRRLGVAVAAVRVDGRALDAACFGAGFHPPEADGGRRWRWTDGAAQVLLPACDRACVVDMELDAPGRHYWLAPDRDCAGAALSG